MQKIGFFTPIKSWDSSVVDIVEDYFYWFGPKAFIVPWKNILEGQETDVRYPKQNVLLKIILIVLKIVSYFTLVIPAILLTAKIIFRTTHQFYLLSEKKMASPKIIQKIEAVLDKVIELEKDPDILYYSCQPDHRVFSLKSVPALIFKLVPENNQKVRERFKMRNIIREKCDKQSSNLLVVPKAVLVAVKVHARKYQVIVEEKFKVDTNHAFQKSLFQEGNSLLKASCQLARLITVMKLSDVNYRNYVALPDSKDVFGDRRIVLLDYEETDGAEYGIFGRPKPFYREGLLGMVASRHEQQVIKEFKKQISWTREHQTMADRVLTKKATELDKRRKLEQFYAAHQIIRGNEQLKNIPRLFQEEVKADHLNQLAKLLIEAVNKAVANSKAKSIQQFPLGI